MATCMKKNRVTSPRIRSQMGHHSFEIEAAIAGAEIGIGIDCQTGIRCNRHMIGPGRVADPKRGSRNDRIQQVAAYLECA